MLTLFIRHHKTLNLGPHRLLTIPLPCLGQAASQVLQAASYLLLLTAGLLQDVQYTPKVITQLDSVLGFLLCLVPYCCANCIETAVIFLILCIPQIMDSFNLELEELLL